MKRRVFNWCFAVGLIVAVSACNNKGAGGTGPAASGAGSAGASGKLKIAVIPKGTTHEFWKSVHAGAVKASRELGVEIVWKGPLKEDDLKQQVDLVQSFTAQGVSGIVLAPLNDKALAKSVKDATRCQDPGGHLRLRAPGRRPRELRRDRQQGGRRARRRRAWPSCSDGKGKVLVLRYQEGSASTTNREEGFLEAVKAHGT